MKDIFDHWLTNACQKKASDIHLTIGKAPIFRVHGKLIEQPFQTIKPMDTRKICQSILTEPLWEKLNEERELDFSYGVHGVSRFRINAFFQRGELSLAIRIVARSIPTLDELRLPEIVKKIVNYPQGLVLVTGPTGSGKSSTLAAMIGLMNKTMQKNIITLEDPIEYTHQHDQCLIDQREIGFDTKSFVTGLRASLRQDPDVILVGEMRDYETISTAITAAETGHLVLGTLHTANTTSTIERIIDVFPAEQQSQVRMQLSSLLAAVISQRLLITKEGNDRIVTSEILVNTPAIQNLIRNENIHQIQNVLQTSKDQGMHTFEMDLRRLLRDDKISYETALPYF